MKRFDVSEHAPHNLNEDEGGDYVLFKDHAARIKELEAMHEAELGAERAVAADRAVRLRAANSECAAWKARAQELEDELERLTGLEEKTP
jgi:hypothetical protein